MKTFPAASDYKPSIRIFGAGSLSNVMGKAKKLFLLREKREIWRVRIGKKVHTAMCPECRQEVHWLSGAEAAKVSDLPLGEIFRLAERGEIHFAESDVGLLVVCQRSLGERSREETG